MLTALLGTAGLLVVLAIGKLLASREEADDPADDLVPR